MRNHALTPPGTGTQESLRVLILEDDPGDAALIRRALARTAPGAHVRWTSTRDGFNKELADFSPQLVLSNYRLADFDGLSALSLVKERSPETPFIMISGVIGEKAALESLKRGATDCVLKDPLERLEIVLARALRERREREDRLKAEAALRESQAQLLQSQKMDALGRLAGGVAHDFNNILTAITGYCELLLLNPEQEQGLRGDLQEIHSAAFRATALTGQLLAFSRRRLSAPKVLDLNRTLLELDRMLQRILGADIKLTIIPAPDFRHVRADSDQIGQVILNLVINARDAMPKGGAIVLSAANVELDAAALRAQPGVRPGRFVRISVEDNGESMDAETLPHIFEPFFTTKSKGTGLGLATAYGIVKQSNGFIEVDSRRGAGSVFRICLPAVDAEVTEARKPSSPRSLNGSETILVVDDDPAVVRVVRRLLERRGYTVLEASGGEEALRRCADPKTPLHLVLTDVDMAGMRGPELARRIKAARPACKLLFASGYAEGGITELADRKERFITKPFNADDLAKVVREILDAPSP